MAGRSAGTLQPPIMQSAEPPAKTAPYAAIAVELADLAGMAEDLQTATGVLLQAFDSSSAAPGLHHYNLQTLDILTQRLHALAGFFDAMPDVELAISRVSLSDLARRLRGEEEAPGWGASPNEFELF